MDPRERRALLTVLILGIGGHLLRATKATERLGLPRGHLLADSTLNDDLDAHLRASEALARPLAPGERIDVDRVGPTELRRLPGIGPALGARIVADRESLGVFGGTDALARVAGIGPATIARIEPYLTFSGSPSDDNEDRLPERVRINRAGEAEFRALPGIGPVRARAIVAFRDSAGPFRNIDGLALVPGISPGLVGRITPRLAL